MVNFRLMDFVILGGLGSFSFFALDHALNEGKVFGRVKHHCNEAKQSVLNGGEKHTVDDDKTSIAESPNEGQEKSSGVASGPYSGPAEAKKDGFTADGSNFDVKNADDQSTPNSPTEPLDGSDDRDEELSKRMTNIGI